MKQNVNTHANIYTHTQLHECMHTRQYTHTHTKSIDAREQHSIHKELPRYDNIIKCFKDLLNKKTKKYNFNNENKKIISFELETRNTYPQVQTNIRKNERVNEENY